MVRRKIWRLLMRIQQVADKTGLSSHTLRYYEKLGLLHGIERDSRGYRCFRDKDVTWVELIKRLKATKMPLAEIKRFAQLRVRGDCTIAERLDILYSHRQRVERQIEELHAHRSKIEEKIALCERGGPLSR